MENIVLEKLITTNDLTKIPKKKMNYKQYLYRQRIRYGKFINIGLVNDKIKFVFNENKLTYKLDTNCDKNLENYYLNDPFYKSLFYCSELDFSVMLSKREINLRKNLIERINRLKELTKKN